VGTIRVPLGVLSISERVNAIARRRPRHHGTADVPGLIRLDFLSADLVCHVDCAGAAASSGQPEFGTAKTAEGPTVPLSVCHPHPIAWIDLHAIERAAAGAAAPCPGADQSQSDDEEKEGNNDTSPRRTHGQARANTTDNSTTEPR
jgi:hypothetical protein